MAGSSRPERPVAQSARTTSSELAMAVVTAVATAVVTAAATGVAAMAAVMLPMAADEAVTAMAAAPMRVIGTKGVAGTTPAKATRTITPPITITIIATTGTAATTGIIGGTEGPMPAGTATAIARGSAVRR
jgi:hypothetical protein